MFKNITTSLKLTVAIFATLTVTSLTGTSLAQAKEAAAKPNQQIKNIVGPISIESAQIYIPLKGSNVTAGYGRIVNTTNEAQTLEVVGANAFKSVEMHATEMKDGKMSMKHIEQLALAPHSTTEFKPGAHHFMLFDATHELKVGDTVQMKFKVSKSKDIIEIPFKVVSR